MWIACKEVRQLLNRADARIGCFAAGDLCEREIGNGGFGFNLAPSTLPAGELLQHKAVQVEQFVFGFTIHDFRRLVVYGSRVALYG